MSVPVVVQSMAWKSVSISTKQVLFDSSCYENKFGDTETLKSETKTQNHFNLFTVVET